MSATPVGPYGARSGQRAASRQEEAASGAEQGSAMATGHAGASSAIVTQGEMDMPDVTKEEQVLEGFLKQQSVDSSGIYQWNRKFFRLHPSRGVIEVFDGEDLDVSRGGEYRLNSSRDASVHASASFSSGAGLAADSISLAGLRAAKEWSAMTSALGSCGFDLLWASGRIWSFLADDELICKQWVRAINHSLELIYSNVRGTSMSLDSLAALRSPPSSPPRDSAPEPVQPISQADMQPSAPAEKNVDKKLIGDAESQHDKKEVGAVQQSTAIAASDVTVEFGNSPYHHGGATHHRGSDAPKTEPRFGHGHNPSRGISVDDLNRAPLSTPPRNIGSGVAQQGQNAVVSAATTAFASSPGMHSISHIARVSSSVDGSSQNSDGSHGDMSGDEGEDALLHHAHSNRAHELTHLRVQQTWDRHSDDEKPHNSTNKGTEKMRLRSNTHDPSGAIIDSDDARVRSFQRAALVAEAEAESLKEELAYMKQQMKDSMRAVAEKHAAARDQDKKTIQKLRSELDHLMIESASSVSKGGKSAIDYQHLEEQLLEERRRHQHTIERYSEEMRRSEAQGDSMREKLLNLRSRCEELETELHNMRTTEGAKSGSEGEEVMLLRQENRKLKLQIESMAAENAAKTNNAVNRAIDQLNASFAETTKQVEKAAQESAKKLYDSMKASELLAMQSICNQQIETVKAEAQAKAVRDLEQQRKTFEARESQTMLDLQQLEGLHQHRVDELEVLVRTVRARAETAEEALSAAAVSRVRMSVASRDITNERIKQLETYAETAGSLQAALHSKNEELLDVRAKESSYTEQLRRLMEENNVLRAQSQAALRQAALDASDAIESKRSRQDLELRIASMSSSLAIAREETFMLENEVNRLKALNSHLQEALDRADNVIYGNGVLSASNQKRGSLLSFKAPAASLNQKSFGKTKIVVMPSEDPHMGHGNRHHHQQSSSDAVNMSTTSIRKQVQQQQQQVFESPALRKSKNQPPSSGAQSASKKKSKSATK